MGAADRNRRYERSVKGIINNPFKRMRSRVRGGSTSHPHLYKGLEICSKEDFVGWSTTDENFLTAYISWVDSGYSRSLSPSIDRVDSSRGYTFDNMEWVTVGENTRRANINR